MLALVYFHIRRKMFAIAQAIAICFLLVTTLSWNFAVGTIFLPQILFLYLFFLCYGDVGSFSKLQLLVGQFLFVLSHETSIVYIVAICLAGVLLVKQQEFQQRLSLVSLCCFLFLLGHLYLIRDRTGVSLEVLNFDREFFIGLFQVILAIFSISFGWVPARFKKLFVGALFVLIFIWCVFLFIQGHFSYWTDIKMRIYFSTITAIFAGWAGYSLNKQKLRLLPACSWFFVIFVVVVGAREISHWMTEIEKGRFFAEQIRETKRCRVLDPATHADLERFGLRGLNLNSCSAYSIFLLNDWKPSQILFCKNSRQPDVDPCDAQKGYLGYPKRPNHAWHRFWLTESNFDLTLLFDSQEAIKLKN